LDELAKFFDEHRKGCRPFAESVLSLHGKWKLVKSSILTDDEHARFLSTEFSRHVFTPDDLRAVLQSTVEGCLNELDAIESQLLVELRADLADDKLLSKKLKLDLQSDEAFRQTVKRIVKDLAPSLGIDLAVSGGSLAATMVGPGALAIDAVSSIIVRVLAAVAADAGITGTFYGAGVISSGATLGVSLLVFAVADRIIAQLLAACGYDAEAKVASDVDASLRQTRDRIILGIPEATRDYLRICEMASKERNDSVREACLAAKARIERGGALGLRRELLNVHETRSRLRREALRTLLMEADDTAENEKPNKKEES
jgi:hypothetical protein